MRTALLAIAAIATALPCAAQTANRPGTTRVLTEDERVAALLRSADAREQAWGAWAAGRDRRRQLQPLLGNIVARRVAAVGTAETAARDQALDALIQMEATIEPDLLPVLHEHRPAEALILAANAPEVPADFLLEILRTKNGEQWFAAANMLLKTRPRGFAFAVLRDLKIEVTISITTHGNGLGGGRGGGSGGMGCGAAASAPGLPPWPSYDLTTFGRAGVVVHTMGPHPVYYTRTVTPEGSSRWGGVRVSSDPTSQHRLDYVSTLLFKDPPQLGIRGMEFHSVTWTTDAALQRDVARIRDRIEQRLRIVVAQLQSADLISAEEVQVLPASMTELHIRDLRATRD